MRPRTLTALLVLALAARDALAADPPATRVAGVTATLVGRELRVSARLSPGLPKALAARLASGLPTSVSWRIAFFSNRELWWDGKKGERRYEVTATYRPDSDRWAVERRLDGRLLETDVLPTREDAGRALDHIVEFPAFTMGKHLHGKSLVVKVAARFGTNVTLGVVPSDAETPWRRSPVFVWKEPPA